MSMFCFRCINPAVSFLPGRRISLPLNQGLGNSVAIQRAKILRSVSFSSSGFDDLFKPDDFPQTTNQQMLYSLLPHGVPNILRVENNSIIHSHQFYKEDKKTQVSVIGLQNPTVVERQAPDDPEVYSFERDGEIITFNIDKYFVVLIKEDDVWQLYALTRKGNKRMFTLHDALKYMITHNPDIQKIKIKPVEEFYEYAGDIWNEYNKINKSDDSLFPFDIVSRMRITSIMNSVGFELSEVTHGVEELKFLYVKRT